MSAITLRSLADRLAPVSSGTLELSAEFVSIQIRWFGLAVGAALANFGPHAGNALSLNIILSLGLAFTALDTICYRLGRVFLRDDPLLISAMEALFIGMLCYFEAGLESPFRLYYFLSLVCAAIRYRPRITFVTCGFDCLSFTGLFFLTTPDRHNVGVYALMLIMLGWVAWAAGAMARLLKDAGRELGVLNQKLQENQAQLEVRIVERTQQLEDSQAQVQHQEKMAAFGLLAAGIAHEVGNPLTGISGVVQMLEHRNPDAYTKEKLALVTAQLSRIQTILRELIVFSRPASDQRGKIHIRDVIDEALSIAKYYKGGKNRKIEVEVENDLPVITGVRDQLIQVVFNLVLNSIDATDKGGLIRITAHNGDQHLNIRVIDDGIGIDPQKLPQLFRPYFTTKRHGTGLGLFVIRRIVESHGGNVSVDSELGKGTTFEFRIPTI